MSITLKSGLVIPSIGLGTHGIYGNTVNSIITDAKNIGYRLIDTATSYNNHKEIGQTIKNFRKEMIICTKVNENDFQQFNIHRVCKNILMDLQADYIDLLLLHSPVTNYEKLLEPLIRLKEEKYIRSVGVSNFSVKHLETIKDYHNHIDVNQVEFHPYLNDKDLLIYCQSKNIRLMAYRPFAKNIFIDDPIINQIALFNKKSIHQVVLSWLIDKEVIVLPKSVSSSHLQENFDSSNFILSSQETLMMDNLNKMIRTCSKNTELFK